MKKKRIFKLLSLALVYFFISMKVSASCDAVLTQDAAEFIKEIVDLIRLVVPILLLVMGIVDMAGVVLSSDQDAIKKKTSDFAKRALAAVLVFFVPLFINLLLSIPAVNNSLNLVDDPMCGIDKVNGENNEDETNNPSNVEER